MLQICELEQLPLGKARVMVCLMHLHVYICSHLSSSAAAAEGQTPSALSCQPPGTGGDTGFSIADVRGKDLQ